MESKITNLYVTYQVSNGGFEHDTVEVKGKVHHYPVEQAIKDTLSYYRQHESITVVAWSVEEEFTYEEEESYWKGEYKP